MILMKHKQKSAMRYYFAANVFLLLCTTLINAVTQRNSAFVMVLPSDKSTIISSPRQIRRNHNKLPGYYCQWISSSSGSSPPSWSSSSLFSSIHNNDEVDVIDTQNLSPNGKRSVRFRGRIAYDGTSFGGWQFQPNSRTVQGELEAVLSRRFDRTVRVVGAGRTDAGVHARGQAFHFDLLPKDFYRHSQKISSSFNMTDDNNNNAVDENVDVDPQELQHSINSMLRRDMRVWDLSMAPSSIIKDKTTNPKLYSWHAIASSTKKLYSYRIYVGPAMDPLHRYTRAHVHDPEFQIEKLEHVLELFEGTHDFRAFSGAIEQNAKKQGKTAATTDTIRTIYSIKLVKESSTHHGPACPTNRSGDGNYRIDVLLNGALYKMVRNIVGTALDVCRDRLSEDTLMDFLQQRIDPSELDSDSDGGNNNHVKYFDRDSNPCKPAPPEGLTLERVFYYDDF